MMKEAVPSIRFKDFEEKWEGKKLGDVTNSYSGGTPSIKKTEYYGGEIPFIRSAEINKKETELFITNLGLQESSAKLVNKGDILYALYGATSGEVGISQIEGAINQAILAIKPDSGHSAQFIMQWLRLQKNNIVDKYLQGGQGNLSASIVKNLKLNFPKYSEQSAIGSLFQKLDRLIALHQDKLALMKAQKHTYLRLMFPQKGKKVPELRFQGFAGEWEEKKLGEITQILKGSQRGKHEISAVRDSENIYPVYNGGQSISGYTNEYNRENKIIVSEGGASAGFVNYVNDKFWSGGHNYSVDNLANDLYFIRANLDSNQSRLYNLKIGSGLPNIQLASIKMFDFFITAIEEQTAIGNFFQSLDKTIALQEKKLEQLREQKKSLLSKMFV